MDSSKQEEKLEILSPRAPVPSGIEWPPESKGPIIEVDKKVMQDYVNCYRKYSPRKKFVSPETLLSQAHDKKFVEENLINYAEFLAQKYFPQSILTLKPFHILNKFDYFAFIMEKIKENSFQRRAKRITERLDAFILWSMEREMLFFGKKEDYEKIYRHYWVD
jgi:hypothetical protein